MGAGASVFKRKGGAKGAIGDNKVSAAGSEKGATETEAKSENEGVQKNGPNHEESQAIEGVRDILCRLTQAYPTQTPRRWDLITQKLNSTMRKKKIPAQPLKALIAKEGLCIPQCWEVEKVQRARNKELARAKKLADANVKGSFASSLFGRKKVATGVGQKGTDAGAEVDDLDTDLDSDLGEDTATGDPDAGDDEPGYSYERLSKYEVFSYMRRVHDDVGVGVVETEEAVENTELVEKVVDILYEHLPAHTSAAKSQQNRIKAGLGQDSLVYGEIEISHFSKVMVKLKRIHGHLASPGGSFWDLGAGMGKVVIAAAMMHNFESCYGVEILEDVRSESRTALDRWRKEEAPKLKAAKAAIRVDFIFADALEQQGWVVDATLLFVHTNFSPTQLLELKRKAGGMKVGAICLSVSLAAVDEDKWGLLAVERIRTSWGATKLYLHEKLAE